MVHKPPWVVSHRPVADKPPWIVSHRPVAPWNGQDTPPHDDSAPKSTPSVAVDGLKPRQRESYTPVTKRRETGTQRVNSAPSLKRAERSAQNAGMPCLFNTNYEKSTGGRPSTDVHLDRMAAYLVAMNGDPRKPEVASAQAYFAMDTAAPSPFDQIARTDAEGNAFWSARDLMPLMGYRNVNAWQPFRANVINRAEKTAENTDMTCHFTHVSEVVNRHQGGTVERKDVHLDRMAAYLVAMNGDPNKPEVAAMKTAQSIGVGYLFTDVCEKAPVVTAPTATLTAWLKIPA